MSTVGTEQRTCSPVSVFTKRKPPAVALAVLDLATIGRFTRAVLVVLLVMTEAGETPTSEIPAESQAGMIPGAVVQVKLPVAGCSVAWAGLRRWRGGERAAMSVVAAARGPILRAMGTPAVGGRLPFCCQDNPVSTESSAANGGEGGSACGRVAGDRGGIAGAGYPGVDGAVLHRLVAAVVGPALAVVRPGSVEEVSAVVRACAAAGVPVLPQGGNTGLVGGSVPALVESAIR